MSGHHQLVAGLLLHHLLYDNPRLFHDALGYLKNSFVSPTFKISNVIAGLKKTKKIDQYWSEVFGYINYFCYYLIQATVAHLVE